MKNYFNITSITEREKLIERNVINKEMHQTQCSQSNDTKKWKITLLQKKALLGG